MSDADNEFKIEHAKRHGWPLEEYDWYLRRERMRNWQRPGYGFDGRKKLISSRLKQCGDGPNMPCRFCPRCGSAIAWIEKDKFQNVDLTPIDREDCWCCACDEHFSIKTMPCPYSKDLEGMKRRRAATIANSIAPVLKKHLEQQKKIRSYSIWRIFQRIYATPKQEKQTVREKIDLNDIPAHARTDEILMAVVAALDKAHDLLSFVVRYDGKCTPEFVALCQEWIDGEYSPHGDPKNCQHVWKKSPLDRGRYCTRCGLDGGNMQ